MTKNKSLFKSVADIDGGDISFEENSKVKVIGSGTVSINESCNITNFYLVKSLKYTLLSINKSCDVGLKSSEKMGVLLKCMTISFFLEIDIEIYMF